MGAYVTLWTTGVGAIMALIAVLVLRGGWEAGAAAIAIAMGAACVFSLIVLWVESEHSTR
jgi:hypothetical protein